MSMDNPSLECGGAQGEGVAFGPGCRGSGAMRTAVLDACCGPRMFWFDAQDDRALFIDKRRATYAVDVGTPGTRGRSPIVVDPDILADFTDLPFPDASFHLVVFDPPHVQREEMLGAVTRRYGVLKGDWREMLRRGFAECFRVLKPNGVLVFKWGEAQFRIKEILELTPEKPLFGHKTGKTTHWCVFIRDSDQSGKAGETPQEVRSEGRERGPSGIAQSSAQSPTGDPS